MNNFNSRGYLVSKDDNSGTLFLSRQQPTSSSRGAIGDGPTNWTAQPDVNSIFGDKEEAQKLSNQHQGSKLTPVSIDVKVEEGATA